MTCGHGWRSASDCDTCTIQRVAPKAAARIEALEGELRGVIYEMEQIVGECRLGRDWNRVEMLADNVHTVLRIKLRGEKS